MNFRVLLVGLLLVETAFARFSEDDADDTENERRLSTEYYNDEVSYRYPIRWIRQWDASPIGFRVSAGSLNINRFLYFEDVKLGSYSDDLFWFDFHQSAEEDTLEQRQRKVVRVATFLFQSPFHLNFMGDGDTDKKWGDVGVGLGWAKAHNKFVDLTYWSVDHYYNTKEDAPDDRYKDDLYSVTLRSHWNVDDLNYFKWFYEYDSPVRWNRPSHLYDYEYDRQKLHIDGQKSITEKVAIRARAYIDRKKDKKTTTDKGGAFETEKAFSRMVRIYTLESVILEGSDDINFGIEAIRRDTDYHMFLSPPFQQNPEYVAANTYHDSYRKEHVFYTTYNYQLSNKHRRMQWGLHFNQVLIQEDVNFSENEVKLQWAYDYAFNDDSRVFLNTTWDLNQLQKDFPYDEEPFKPWGGGHIQFQLDI